MLSSFGALVLSTAFTSVLAVTVGGFDDGGNTLVSAMMVSPLARFRLFDLKSVLYRCSLATSKAYTY